MLARDKEQRRARSQRSRRIPARLVWLGVAAICGAVAEGALVGWSGIYLRESLHVSLAAALGGFAAYAVAMSGSRFCGDWIVDRIGPVVLVRTSGIVATAGIALALVVHTYTAVLAGFFVTGVGLANVSPLVYGAGADGTDNAGAGVAVVTTLGYGGFLIGPSLIGFTAAHASIDVAFAFVGVFAAVIAALAPGAARSRARSSAGRHLTCVEHRRHEREDPLNGVLERSAVGRADPLVCTAVDRAANGGRDKFGRDVTRRGPFAQST